eukprot:TRINITY_DN3830_c0_g1_i1.p1 TRINITY_DN3830_c0_g1~~TRINITY_DN3830_c0_g1_i1.p1  ORF type:complete len:377 (+),score=86.66 TRINITY_DN3830_c0_g1_i1:354-1484(+)
MQSLTLRSEPKKNKTKKTRKKKSKRPMFSPNLRFHLTGTLALVLNFVGFVLILAALVIDTWATTTFQTPDYYYSSYYFSGQYFEQEWGLTEVRTGSSSFGIVSYQECGSTFKDCNNLESSGLIVASFGAVSVIFAFFGLVMHPFFQFNPKSWGAHFKRLAIIGYVLAMTFSVISVFVWISEAQTQIKKIMDDANDAFQVTVKTTVGPSWILVMCGEVLLIFGTSLSTLMFSIRSLRQFEGGTALSGFAPLSGDDYEPPTLLHQQQHTQQQHQHTQQQPQHSINPVAPTQIRFKVEYSGGKHSVFLTEPVNFNSLFDHISSHIVKSRNFSVKYQDNEGDMMVLSNQSQLNEAIRASGGVASVRLVVESPGIQFQEVQ